MIVKRSRLYLMLAGGVAILVVAAGAAGPIMSRVETPEYTVEQSEGPVEIRAYRPMIAAEADVKGSRREAIGEGFRLIAAYIFGANAANVKIDMTAPVEQERRQNPAVTAPAPQGSEGGTARDGDTLNSSTWTVRFILPKKWTMESLPVPTGSRISLLPLAAKRMAVIRFSGSADDRELRAKTAELQTYITDHKLVPVKGPLFAFYNPPWTLPFLRRNEIMFELAEPTAGAG